MTRAMLVLAVALLAGCRETIDLTTSEPQWVEGQQYTCQAVTAETQGWIMSGFLEAVGFASLAIVAVLVMIAIAQAIANTFTLLDKHEQLRDQLNDQIGDLSAKIDQRTKEKKERRHEPTM